MQKPSCDGGDGSDDGGMQKPSCDGGDDGDGEAGLHNSTAAKSETRKVSAGGGEVMVVCTTPL